MNKRFYGTLLACVVFFAAGIVGLWCLKDGLLDLNTRGGRSLAVFSAMAPFWAILIAIVTVIYRNKTDV